VSNWIVFRLPLFLDLYLYLYQFLCLHLSYRRRLQFRIRRFQTGGTL
jgi:hypothetical protein